MIDLFGLEFKGFTDNISTMKVVLLLLCLGLAVSAAAHRTSDEHRERLALVVTTDSSPSTRANSVSGILPRAILNHYQYLSYGHNNQYEVMIRPEGMDRDSVLARLRREGYTLVMVVMPDASLATYSRIVADSHRRRYFAEIGGFLNISLGYQIHRFVDSKWQLQETDLIIENSRRPTGRPRYGIDRPMTSGTTDIEPYRHVVQRAVATLFDAMPSVPGNGAVPAQVVPVRVEPGNALNEAIVKAASGSLVRQFGTGLHIVSEGVDSDGPDADCDVRAWLRGDTLNVEVETMLSPGYRFSRRRSELGTSRLGRNQIYIRVQRASEGQDMDWRAQENGLTLLHETGHSMGCLHVGDIGSVMNHTEHWSGADDFDPVNDRIARAALSGELTFDSPAGYLSFVSTVLQESDYGLADYPAFFYRYLSHGANRRMAKLLRAAIGRQSYLEAVDAYGLLMAGRSEFAAALFRKAVEADPHQAALYHYLSLATTGVESQQARGEATRLGYAPALEGHGLRVAYRSP